MRRNDAHHGAAVGRRYLKPDAVRFTVFDESEQDTEAMLGSGVLPLAPLLTATAALTTDVALTDEARHVTRPSPYPLCSSLLLSSCLFASLLE